MTPRILLTSVVLAVVLGIQASATTIQDGYLQVTINDIGTLGSGTGSPNGFKYDQFGTSNFGGTDFLARSPFEGFYITANGGSYEQHSANWVPGLGTSSSTFSATPAIANTPDSAVWSSTSLDGTLAVSNSYLVQSNGLRYVFITTSIGNASDTTLTDVQFLRTLTPDADGFGVPGTGHVLGMFDGACGLGTTATYNAICLGAVPGGGFVSGISSAWSTIPADYLAGLNDGGFDNAIGLALDIGDLAPHDVVTFQYYYAAATGIPNQNPEPLSIALFGAGLAGVGALRRRKK